MSPDRAHPGCAAGSHPREVPTDVIERLKASAAELAALLRAVEAERHRRNALVVEAVDRVGLTQRQVALWGRISMGRVTQLLAAAYAESPASGDLEAHDGTGGESG